MITEVVNMAITKGRTEPFEAAVHKTVAVFRENPLFQEWHALVASYFFSPPKVKHDQIAMDRAAISEVLK